MKCQSPLSHHLSVTDVESMIMDEVLSDVHINLARNLLKGQFPKLYGLQYTLLQEKSKIDIKEDGMIQIVHCINQHHWIVTTTIGNKGNDILVFDSIFHNVNERQRKLFFIFSSVYHLKN